MRNKQGGSLTTEPLQHSVSQQEERGEEKEEEEEGGTGAYSKTPHASWPFVAFFTSSFSRMNSTTTQPPAHKDGGVAVSYVLVPVLLITVAGIAALIIYLRRKRRIDRLRHQLLPVYTYDPAEELHEVEQELLWREEDTRIVQGWARSYQQHQPLLSKDVTA